MVYDQDAGLIKVRCLSADQNAVMEAAQTALDNIVRGELQKDWVIIFHMDYPVWKVSNKRIGHQ